MQTRLAAGVNAEKSPRPRRLALRKVLLSTNAELVAALCFLLLLLIALVYAQATRFHYINFDDPDYVSQNFQVQKGLTAEGILWAFHADGRTANWHPLTWLSLMLDRQFYGTNWPGGFHLTNVLLHAANSVLVLLLLRGASGRVWPCALVAGVFAVHPLHVESVAWITERKDVLSGFFGLLTIWAYIRYVRELGFLRYLTVAAALALGLLAKSTLVTWPLLLLLLDFWPLRRPPGIELLLEKLPLLLLSVAVAIIAYFAQRGAVRLSPRNQHRCFRGFSAPAWLYAFYLGKTIWPCNLALYPVEETTGFGPAIAAWGLLLLITAAAVWAAWHGGRWVAVGWFWFLGTLVPTIGLVQVGTEVLADRFVYLPQIGLCIAVVWSAAGLYGRGRGAIGDVRFSLTSSIASIGGRVLLASLAAVAWQQTSYWRNSEMLWTHALNCTSRNFMAHFKLGKALEKMEPQTKPYSTIGSSEDQPPRRRRSK